LIVINDFTQSSGECRKTLKIPECEDEKYEEEEPVVAPAISTC
jgi:hypothetical protein